MPHGTVHKLNGSETSCDATSPSTSPKSSNAEESSHSTISSQVSFFLPQLSSFKFFLKKN